jgi:hypothetical protein
MQTVNNTKSAIRADHTRFNNDTIKPTEQEFIRVYGLLEFFLGSKNNESMREMNIPKKAGLPERLGDLESVG